MSKNYDENGAFRKIGFAQVSSVVLKDKNLSLRAKGLYSLIQNFITLKKFVIYKNYLMTISTDGKDSFNRAWDELKLNGYLVQHKSKNKAGHFVYEYELLEKPCKLSPEELAHLLEKEEKRKEKNKEKAAKEKAKTAAEKAIQKFQQAQAAANSSFEASTDGITTDGTSTSISYTEGSNTYSNTISTTDTSVVVDYIEKVTKLKLTSYQIKLVSKWSFDKLKRATDIFNNLGGLYFKLLQKIYNDGAKGVLFSRSNTVKRDPNEGLFQHDWDLDLLEQQQMARKSMLVAQMQQQKKQGDFCGAFVGA